MKAVDIMRRTILLAIALVLAAPFVAVAVESTDTTPGAPPLATGSVEIQYWMAANPNEAVAIVSVDLPETAELPATVRVPLIEGMTIDWAGEISGGDATTDIQREFTVKQGPSGGSFAEFVLSEFRSAQVDLSGKPHTITGDRVSATFDFVQPLDEGGVGLSVRVPSISSDVKIDPEPAGDPRVNELGEKLYRLPGVTLATGEKTTVEVDYSATLGATGGAADSFNIVIGVLAAVVAVMLVVIVVFTTRGSKRGDRVADEED